METMNLTGTQTAINLMKAFAGESQAFQRYMLFAETAPGISGARCVQSLSVSCTIGQFF